ncbi:MAG: LamG-like jellyroll fold domain-containing protein [bacterium]
MCLKKYSSKLELINKTVCLLIVVLLVSNLFGDIDDNRVAYYAFEHDVEDSISGIDGSFKNGAYRTTASSAGRGMAVSLDGVNDYVELRDFNPANSSGDFSISFWYYNSNPNQGDHCYIGKHTSTGSNNFLVGFWSGYITIQVWNQYRRLYNIYPLNYNWNHLVVTIDAGTDSYAAKVYLNGVQVQSYNGTVTPNITTGKKWVVGQDWDGSSTSDHFQGRIDDINFYSKVLTSTDVSNLYQNKYGVPRNLYTYTFAIEDYPSGSDLPYAFQDVDSFVDGLYDSLSDHKYDDGMQYPPCQSYELENEEVTVSALASNQTDGSEFVFFAGHGSKYGVAGYDGTLGGDDKDYNGSTKWVVYCACQTLYNPAEQVQAFGQNHAIFGLHSSFVGWRRWDYGDAEYDYSYDVWGDFATNWVKNRDPMWEAWVDAFDDTYTEYGHGIKIGALQRRLDLYGKYFSGNYQRIYDTYQGGVSSGSIWSNYVTFGTPVY